MGQRREALAYAGYRAERRDDVKRLVQAISKALVQKDPGNTVWQTAVVLSLNRLAGAGDDPRANLSEALVILKRLRADGKLSPALENLKTRIEAALANIAN